MSKIKDTLTSLDYKYLDKALQDEIKPGDALAALEAGNARFVSGNTVKKAFDVQVSGTSQGQYPHSVVLSCIDSRVPAEIIFDQGIGDIFSARVAGNTSNVDVLGSIEYACKVAGSKLVVVLGHTSCGAVKGAISDVKLGNITELISKIKPAIAETKANYSGSKTVDNADFVNKVVEENVLQTIAVIKKESPVLREMLENDEIDIKGAIYDVASGKVVFM
jgi:carbonic anhydrase